MKTKANEIKETFNSYEIGREFVTGKGCRLKKISKTKIVTVWNKEKSTT